MESVLVALENIVGAALIVDTGAKLVNQTVDTIKKGTELVATGINFIPDLADSLVELGQDFISPTFDSKIHGIDSNNSKMNPFNLSRGHFLPPHHDYLRKEYNTPTDETHASGILKLNVS